MHFTIQIEKSLSKLFKRLKEEELGKRNTLHPKFNGCICIKRISTGAESALAIHSGVSFQDKIKDQQWSLQLVSNSSTYWCIQELT